MLEDHFGLKGHQFAHVSKARLGAGATDAVRGLDVAATARGSAGGASAAGRHSEKAVGATGTGPFAVKGLHDLRMACEVVARHCMGDAGVLGGFGVAVTAGGSTEGALLWQEATRVWPKEWQEQGLLPCMAYMALG